MLPEIVGNEVLITFEIGGWKNMALKGIDPLGEKLLIRRSHSDKPTS